MSTQLIGQRLKQLRNELAGLGEQPWTQNDIAIATGLTQNALTRLEHTGAGTIETLTALLTFYHSQGYNPNWVILADNSAILKRHLPSDSHVVATSAVQAKMEALKTSLTEQLDAALKALTA